MPGGETIPYILATAGHVDHGKSALVKALTGTDPDRLPEEKARGLTIELGFASFRLPVSDPGGTGVPPVLLPQGHGRKPGLEPITPQTDEFEIGVIDVPGHEDFVRNMVAGVGSIDAALLVVAADDGWMPQTEEHFQILSHLGVTRGVVALSKIDLASDESESLRALKKRLHGTIFQDAPIVPTSVVTGRGIEPLKIALAHLFAATPQQPDIGKPRLPVDRVFVVKGIGVVVTGTLTGGTLRRGEAVIVQPARTAARIRSVQTYSHEVELARPGSRVALNLPDLHPAARRGARAANSVARGDVITVASLGVSTSQMDVAVTCDRIIRNNSVVQIHHGASAVQARFRWFQPGSPSLARFTLDELTFTLSGDRLIIRDGSEQHTLGGGIVLDAHPPRSIRWRASARSRQIALLEARARAPHDPAIFTTTQVSRDRATPRAFLLQTSRFSAAQIDAAVSQLAATRSLVVFGDWLIDSAVLGELRDRVIAAVDAHHQSHPEQMGFPLAEVKTVIAAAPGSNDDAAASVLVDAVMAELAKAGFKRTGAILQRATHRAALPARLTAAGEALRRQLSAHPLDPPSLAQLAATDLAHQALRFLIATGEAISISKDLVLSAEAYERAIEILRQRLQSNGPATVSELKTVLGTSRRVMIPLLEKLDRDGITQRQGDLRKWKGKNM